MLPRLRAPLLPLLLAALPAEAARDCEESGAARELGAFLTSSSAIEAGCRHNLRAPANNRVASFGQGGTCERTYRFVNGFVQEVRKKVDQACAQLGDRAGCAPGQAACLEAAAARFRRASATLAEAQELLAQAKAKMGEQRIQVAQVGRAYGEHLAKIGRAVELSRAPGAPRASPLSSPRSEITGADSLRTEGLGSLREVLRASQLPEEPRALSKRALEIDRAFAPDSKAAPDGLGPFAGEQLLAFRHAGEFAEAAARARLELGPLVTGLERNAEKARASAERLGEDPPHGQGEKNPVKLSLNRPGGASSAAAAPPASARQPASRSDLQLRKLAQALLPAEAAKGKESEPLPAAAAAAQEASEAKAGVARKPAPVTMQEYAEPLAEAERAPGALPASVAVSKPVADPVSDPVSDPVAEPASARASAPASETETGSETGTLSGTKTGSVTAAGFAASPGSNPLSPELIPTLSPSEPVVPDSSAPLASREYSLRDQLRARMLQAEEQARSRATLATAQDPDAPPGEQDLRYDRRLTNLQPDDAAFSDEERELARALRDLTAAYPSDLTAEIPEDQATPLFDRVRGAHRRFEQRGMARAP